MPGLGLEFPSLSSVPAAWALSPGPRKREARSSWCTADEDELARGTPAKLSLTEILVDVEQW